MLLLSIIALFAGPLLYQWLRRGGLIARTVETGIVAILVLVVIFLLVPHSLEEMGFLAIALIAAGYLVPGLLEMAVRRAAHAFHVISLLLALFGLIAHAMLDGAGLVSAPGDNLTTLGIAIVLHRFGMGLVLWFMVQPVFGRRAAVAVLVMVSLATVAGYWLSEPLLQMDNHGLLHVVEPLIVGMIIHSLVHRGHAHRHGHNEQSPVDGGQERDSKRSDREDGPDIH